MSKLALTAGRLLARRKKSILKVIFGKVAHIFRVNISILEGPLCQPDSMDGSAVSAKELPSCKWRRKEEQ